MQRNNGLILLLIAAAAAILILSDGGSQHSSPAPDGCPNGQCPLGPREQQALYVAPHEMLHGYPNPHIALDLPQDMRTPNWGGGSCVHASNVTLLRWMGLSEMADWWRSTYSGGEYGSRLVSRLENAGLRYAYTENADFEFLRWCVRTGRGAGIFYKPSHSINMVGMDDQYVYLLDNNSTSYPERNGNYERVTIAEFQRRWRGYGGFGWTLIYNPPPPLPHMAMR